jgi:hypothetical protein
MQQSIAAGSDVLVAERRGPHVLIRRRDEDGPARAFLSGAPGSPEQLFVLVTAGSQGDPAFAATACDLLRSVPGALSGVKTVWFGATGLASEGAVLSGFAKELGVDVCAPDGEFAATPGAAMYAGHGMGAAGWLRFRADGPAAPAGTRFPPPPWESALPTAPVTMAGVVVEPIPAGVLVRAPLAVVDDVAFGVAVDHRFPKIVVGGTGPTPSPAAVAAVLDRLAPKSFLVVPAAPEAASHLWQVELALRLSRDIVFGTGVQPGSAERVPATVALDSSGTALFRPFPTVLRQAVGGGDQEVLDVATPPPGWVRHGPRTYRFAGAAEVLADVVPSGLVLRSGQSPLSTEPASFDPTGWTLNLGSGDETVSLPVLVAAEQLLAGLGRRERSVVRVRISGVLDERAAAVLSGYWDEAGRREAAPAVTPVETAPPAFVPAVVVPPVDVPTVVVPPVAAPAVAVPVAAPVVAAPVVVAPPVVTPPAVLAPLVAPAIMTMSSAPVSTMSGVPKRPAEPAEPETVAATDFLNPHDESPVAELAALTAAATASPAGHAGFAAPAPEPELAPVQVEDVVVEQFPPADEPGERQDHPPPVSAADPEPAADAEPLSPLVIADRPSTSAEQARFTVAAGDAFGEALATVNAALATWPSMRQENTPGVKADYVAVCLYLGRHEGTTGLSGAVRAGHSGPVDGQLPCLVSGIRRLPIHRRAVLRQGKVGESLEHRTATGELLTEPGFLTASMDLDVTMPGADLDVLIWPSSARRTSELMMSHPLEEAVFLAGARFKALAVRTVEDGAGEEDTGGEGAAAPKVAVLYRELAPGESPSTAELDARDLAVLVKLDRVLAVRQKGGLRLVEDPDAVARLTGSMVEWSDRFAVPGKDFRATLATSS